MNHSEYKWVEYAYGGAENRGNVCTVDKLPRANGKKDCYRTIFRYPQVFKQYYDTHRNKTGRNTVSGYNGPVCADFFPLDIDEPDDHEKALQDTRGILNSLLQHYEIDLETLWLFFSGNKGFHVLIPMKYFGTTPSAEIPGAFRHMAGEIAGDTKLDMTIYERVRLLRITNTVHSKSGLYKIPLTAAEVLHRSIDEIRELAKKPRTVKSKPVMGMNVKFYSLYQECLGRVKKVEVTRETQKQEIPITKNTKLCYRALLEGVGEGMRDNAAHRLAVHFLKEYPEGIVRAILHTWNQNNDPPMDERDLDTRIDSAVNGDYDYGCNDPVLSEYCDPKCRFKGKEKDVKITAEKVYTIDEARVKYEEYIARLKERKIALGLPVIDEYMRGIAPGEVCEVMARTGVGKTAFLLNVIRNVIGRQRVPVLFFSLEQPLAQIYERTVQISSEEPGFRVEQGYFQDKAATTLHTLTKQYYDKLYVVDEDMLTYEELKQFIDVATQEKIGQAPSLVCVDYLGRMKGGRGNAYEVTSELARLLKKLAKELDIALLYLHQTSRAGGTGAQEISLDMGRDSGVIEEAADFIIGMWRPDMLKAETQDSDEEKMVISLLKNRKGRVGRLNATFKKACLRIVAPGQGAYS